MNYNYLIGVKVLASGGLEGQIIATAVGQDGTFYAWIKPNKSGSVYKYKLEDLEIRESLFIETRSK